MPSSVFRMLHPHRMKTNFLNQEQLMNKKRSFWLAPLLAGVAATVALVATVVVVPSLVEPTPPPSFAAGSKVDADATFKVEGDAKVEIMNAGSNKYLRSVRKDGDTTEITVVWNKDGESAAGPADRYVIVGGKMRYFARTFDGNRGVHYDVSYDADGVHIATLNKFRENGTLEEQYQHLGNGSRKLVKVNADGRKVSETLIDANGDETVTEFVDGDKPKVTFIKATRSTQAFGVITRNDGSKLPVLKVEMNGDRIASWEWNRNDMKAKIVGRFEADGKLIVETWLEGKRRLVETYQTQIEDWNRSFYRLVSSEAYFTYGDAAKANLDRAYYLRPDGTVERITDGSNNGSLNWTKFYDEKGKLQVHRTYSKDKPNGYTDEDKSGADEYGSVDGTYRHMNFIEKSEIFRIQGEPFIGDPNIKGKIEAFFVEAGKVVGSAEAPPPDPNAPTFMGGPGGP